jgi:hypothetical protein
MLHSKSSEHHTNSVLLSRFIAPSVSETSLPPGQCDSAGAGLRSTVCHSPPHYMLYPHLIHLNKPTTRNVFPGREESCHSFYFGGRSRHLTQAAHKGAGPSNSRLDSRLGIQEEDTPLAPRHQSSSQLTPQRLWPNALPHSQCPAANVVHVTVADNQWP